MLKTGVPPLSMTSHNARDSHYSARNRAYSPGELSRPLTKHQNLRNSTMAAPLPPPVNNDRERRNQNSTYFKLTKQERNDPSNPTIRPPVNSRTMRTKSSTTNRRNDALSQSRTEMDHEYNNNSNYRPAETPLDKLTDRIEKQSHQSRFYPSNYETDAYRDRSKRHSSTPPVRAAGVSSYKLPSFNNKFDDSYSYVPYHLARANYKNDIFEVLKDKLDAQASSFHHSFQRLNKSVGYMGWEVPKEDFKTALVKDFHLFEDTNTASADPAEHEAVRHYQSLQRQKLDEFIDKADTKGDGYIRYSDFIKAVKDLDKQVSVHSTTSERQARYGSTMNNQIQNIVEQKKKDRIARKELKPPPFALYDEAEQYEMYFLKKYKNRLGQLKNSFHHFDVMGEHEKIPHQVFKEGLLGFDKYMTEREVNEMIRYMDPNNKGFINLKVFMDRFGVEMLKSKSLRGTVENGFMSMQWPHSLVEVVPRQHVMDELRIKNSKNTLQARSKPTRTQFLRNDAIQRSHFEHRNRRQMASSGYLSTEQRAKAEVPFYHNTRPSSASASLYQTKNNAVGPTSTTLSSLRPHSAAINSRR
jgi:Ca2+-binding EF-hand superfamily protein